MVAWAHVDKAGKICASIVFGGRALCGDNFWNYYGVGIENKLFFILVVVGFGGSVIDSSVSEAEVGVCGGCGVGGDGIGVV